LPQLPELLVALVNQATPAPAEKESDMTTVRTEQQLFCGEGEPIEHLRQIGDPSPFTCPDCHGGLWRLRGTSPPRFRCHTGHAYSGRTLDHAYGLAGDQAEWNALRALQERAALVEQLLQEHATGGAPDEHARLAQLRESLREQTTSLRRMIDGPGPVP
jgi:two-component system chemotaxis response regulator CheB